MKEEIEGYVDADKYNDLHDLMSKYRSRLAIAKEALEQMRGCNVLKCWRIAHKALSKINEEEK